MKSANWPPLESDPEIFNKYFYSIGLPQNVFFKELISIADHQAFVIVKGPLLGVILNYQRHTVKPKRNEGNYCPPESVPFFIKQTNVLDNACGLIAALHAFGNSSINHNQGSIIEEFFAKATPQTFEERAKILEGFDKFKIAHKSFAQEGQTKLTSEEVDRHFICFINYQDCLYELDGLQSGPYLVKENVKYEQFVDETAKEILRRIQDQEIKEEINVMMVADDKSELIDLFMD